MYSQFYKKIKGHTITLRYRKRRPRDQGWAVGQQHPSEVLPILDHQSPAKRGNYGMSPVLFGASSSSRRLYQLMKISLVYFPSHNNVFFFPAITIGIRVIGPALGFLLGALCTRVYVNPLIDPGYDASDPRWVGAWWLGKYLLIHTLIDFIGTRRWRIHTKLGILFFFK